MIQGRVRRQLVKHVGQFTCIRLRRFYPGLSLGNARGSNELLCLGDLLGGIDGPDTVTQFTKISHGVRSSLLFLDG